MSGPPPSAPPGRSARPSLGNVRGKSYLEEHQQYRPPQQDGHQGIDSIVESLNISGTPPPKAAVAPRYNGVPSPRSPPRVIESGMEHTLSHSNCQPAEGFKSDKVVATLFYKHNAPRISNAAGLPDRSPSPLPPNMAPVRTLSNFPLEPPPADTEPLDHLYGSYISPLCLTSFLALINSLPLPKNTTLASSHRCLDTPHHPLIVELTFSPSPDPEYLSLSDLRKHELLYRFEREWNVDVILQRDTPLRRYPRLVVFDMDSTLIREEVIDLLAASIGVEKEVSAITERAMNGSLDFAASLKERVALLKGVDAEIFTKLRTVITPTPGAKELVRALKRLGIKTAVLSGGFLPLTSWLATSLGIDHAHANHLLTTPDTSTDPPTLLGQLDPAHPIIDAAAKASLLQSIAASHSISLDQTIAIGDGANDLEMMKVAGLGIAFCAKPVVQMEAAARLNGGNLIEVLYLLGFTREEVEVLTAE